MEAIIYSTLSPWNLNIILNRTLVVEFKALVAHKIKSVGIESADARCL